jgi:hypothetical protein
VEVKVWMYVIYVTEMVLLNQLAIVKVTSEIVLVNAVVLVKLTNVVFAVVKESQKVLVTVLVKH